MILEPVVTWEPYTDTVLQSLPPICVSVRQLFVWRMLRCMFQIGYFDDLGWIRIFSIQSRGWYVWTAVNIGCMIGVWRSMHIYSNGKIKQTRFKTNATLTHFWRSYALVLGDHSTLDYSTCWGSKRSYAQCSLWATVCNILNTFILCLLIKWYVIYSSIYAYFSFRLMDW